MYRHLLKLVMFSLINTAMVASASSADSDGTFRGFGKHNRAASKSYSYSTVGSPVREGRKAFRFEVRAGDCGKQDCRQDRERVERRERGGVRPGKDYWYSYSIYLDPSFKDMGPVPTTLGQFKQEPVGPQIMSTIAQKGSLRFEITNPKTQRCCIFEKRIGSVSGLRGRWVDLAYHIRWAADKTGYVKLYVNGRKVAGYKGPTTFNSRNEVSFRFGIYRSFVSRLGNRAAPSQIVYYDNVKRGNTLDAVKP